MAANGEPGDIEFLANLIKGVISLRKIQRGYTLDFKAVINLTSSVLAGTLTTRVSIFLSSLFHKFLQS